MTDILSTVDAVVLNVSTATLLRKSDQSPFTKWTVTTQDGTEWQTFNANLGNQALALQGTMAHLQVKISKSGDFTNYDLMAIRAGATLNNQGTPLTAPVSPVATAIDQARQAAAERPPAPEEVSYATYKSLEGEKTISINRAVAVKVAAQFTGSEVNAADFWQNVSDIFNYLMTGHMAGSSVTSHTTLPELIPTNDGSAYYVHTDADAPPDLLTPKDDIPF